MSKRAELIGAYFDVASGSEGTRVVVAIELPSQLHRFGIPVLSPSHSASREGK